jgi:hypothetical protein
MGRERKTHHIYYTSLGLIISLPYYYSVILGDKHYRELITDFAFVE